MRDEDTDDDAAATTGGSTPQVSEQAPSDAPATFETPVPALTIPETPQAPETLGALGTSLPAQAPADTDPGYNSRGVPTFESVREKIETRYGNALGATELASETTEARTLEEQYEARQKAATERLEQIRESMHPKGDS